jgi:hypothetical protein
MSLFGWGFSIYSIMYLIWSGFVTYGFVEGSAPHVVALLVLVAVLAVAGTSLHLSSWKDILPYSLTWGLSMAILNSAMSVPYVGWDAFSEPYVWISYALVVVVPLFCADKGSLSVEISKWHT